MSKILSANMCRFAQSSHTPHNSFSSCAMDFARCFTRCPSIGGLVAVLLQTVRWHSSHTAVRTFLYFCRPMGLWHYEGSYGGSLVWICMLKHCSHSNLWDKTPFVDISGASWRVRNWVINTHTSLLVTWISSVSNHSLWIVLIENQETCAWFKYAISFWFLRLRILPWIIYQHHQD